MKKWEQALLNAGLMAGLSFIGGIIAFQGEVSLRMVAGAGLSGAFMFFTLMLRYCQPPKTDINGEPMEPKREIEEPASVKHGGGKVLGILWV